MLSVVPDVAGHTLNDVKGTCKITMAYSWNPLAKKWENVRKTEFVKKAVGYGFAVNVKKGCVLSPPPRSGWNNQVQAEAQAEGQAEAAVAAAKEKDLPALNANQKGFKLPSEAQSSDQKEKPPALPAVSEQNKQ